MTGARTLKANSEDRDRAKVRKQIYKRRKDDRNNTSSGNQPNGRGNNGSSSSNSATAQNKKKRRRQDAQDHTDRGADHGSASSSLPINKITYTEEGPLQYISQVGQGTYGKVYKAVDRATSKVLAMKRLRLETQHEGFPVTAAREIKLLQVLRHPNIVRLSEIVVSKNEVYMALDYIEHDLAGLLLNTELKISPANIKSVIRQTITALAFLHEQNVLHRDIKGSNLLVTADGTIKLADFGLARYIDRSPRSVRYTNRVITLWYRPPELLLGAEHYGPAVDTWGVGCLLAEMFIRTPLFYGKDEVSQMQAIYSVMGVPTLEQWPGYVDLPWYHLINSLAPTGSVPINRFKRVFSGPDITPACFDLASQLLAMNPSHRLMAADALKHSYFREEPREKRLELHSEKEWHDWEAKKRKRDNDETV